MGEVDYVPVSIYATDKAQQRGDVRCWILDVNGRAMQHLSNCGRGTHQLPNNHEFTECTSMTDANSIAARGQMRNVQQVIAIGRRRG